MRQLNDLKLVCQEQHNQITVYLNDINTFSRKAGEYEREYNKEKAKNQEITKKVSSMNS
jgi:hypothetical protein